MPNDTELKKLAKTAEESVAFPSLTYDIAQARRAPGAANGGGAGGTTAAIAQQTVRDALGWRYRDDDARGFIAALTKACSLRDVDGHVEWTWNTQPFMAQADLGEVTGALKSVLKQAQNAVEQSLPLLDALYPLRPDVDDGQIDAMRALVRGELEALVRELAQPTGPRVKRVQLLFGQLLGDPNVEVAEEIGGTLGRLRDRLGLNRQRIDTVEEEQNFTNFLILVDYIAGLRRSFTAKLPHFLREQVAGFEPFLGRQLVLLSQQLEVIHEQVQETYLGMDSVFFGAAERQTTVLRLADQAPITVSELLDWVESFSSLEGRRLLEDGGKDGIVSFRQNAHALHELVDAAACKSRENAHNPTRAFHSKRVAFMLDGLAAQVREAEQLAGGISRQPLQAVANAGLEENIPIDTPAPSVERTTVVQSTSVTPCRHGDDYTNGGDHVTGTGSHQVEQGKSYWLAVRGLNLAGTYFSLGAGITISLTRYHGESLAVVKIAVKNTVLGPKDLTYVGQGQRPRVVADAVVVVPPQPDQGTTIEIKPRETPVRAQRGRFAELSFEGKGLEDVMLELDPSFFHFVSQHADDTSIGGMFFVHGNTPLGLHSVTARRPGIEDAEQVLPGAINVERRSGSGFAAGGGGGVDPDDEDFDGGVIEAAPNHHTPELLAAPLPADAGLNARSRVTAMLKTLQLEARDVVELDRTKLLESPPTLNNKVLQLPGALPSPAKVYLFDQKGAHFVGEQKEPGQYRFVSLKEFVAPLSIIAVGQDDKAHYALDVLPKN